MINLNIEESEERLVLNGIDFRTGDYLTSPISHGELVELAKQEFGPISNKEQELITMLSERTRQPQLGFDAPLEDPAHARWGVIFSSSEDDGIKQEIEKLIMHRAAQLGFTPPVFEYTPEMNLVEFLAKQGVVPGFGEVEKVPYYLLLVGSPSQVPYRFQYDLGAEYAVGRLAFSDRSGYGSYIDALIDYETSTNVPTRKKTLFWAPENEGDSVTKLTSQVLATPLYEGLDPKLGFDKDLLLAGNAKRDALVEVLSQPKSPSLVFSASHGLGYGEIDSHQPRFQGALIAQEWVRGNGISRDHLFSGDDLTGSVNVRGMIHFAFACFSAGTPTQDDYTYGISAPVPLIAADPFVANLAQMELEHGALAFVGHVGWAWTYSFIKTSGMRSQVGFERAIKRILRGLPVGHALRDQHDHALQLSHRLLEDLNDMEKGKRIAPSTISELWMERNDARAFAVVGDPAAHLRVQDMN